MSSVERASKEKVSEKLLLPVNHVADNEVSILIQSGKISSTINKHSLKETEKVSVIIENDIHPEEGQGPLKESIQEPSKISDEIEKEVTFEVLL